MTPTCYLLCNNDRLMPAVNLGVNSDGLMEVASPGGVVYTARPDAVVSVGDGAHMLRLRRAEKLVGDGYQIMHLRGDRYRVFNPKTHGETGGYVVTLSATPTCTCPDHADHGFECKHILGAPELLRLAQIEKPTVRVAAVVTERKAAVFTVMPKSAALAAMIAHDGWGE